MSLVPRQDGQPAIDAAAADPKVPLARRLARDWREHLVLQVPLVISYGATFAAVAIATRRLHGPNLTAFLILSSFIPQLGMYGDWGRGAAYLVKSAPRARLNLINPSLFVLERLVPVLAIPTVGVAAIALYGIPLERSMNIYLLGLQILLVIAATNLVVLGNLWRQQVLLRGNVRQFFWLQLWTAALLPIALAITPTPALGGLLIGLFYFIHVRTTAVRQVAPDGHAVGGLLHALRQVLGGDAFTWQVGATQLLMGVSGAMDVSLLAILRAPDLIAYYAITRMVQAATAISMRPIEAAWPALLAADMGRWRQLVIQASALGVGFAIFIALTSGLITRAWVGVAGVPSLLMIASSVVMLLATLAYRGRTMMVLAAGGGRNLLLMGLAELIGKSVIGVLLVPSIGAAGLLLGGGTSALGATVLGSRRRPKS